MNYLLYGDDIFRINNKINEIIEKNSISPFNIIKYDLNIDNYKTIIMDANTISLFQEKKLIIIYNSILFSKNTNEELLKRFEQYLNKPNSNTIIIFVTDNVLLTKKVTKLLINTTFKFNKLQDVTDIVKQLFENYNISNDNIELLISRVGNDLYRLKNETDKIKIYKNNDLNIQKQDIIDLTSKNVDKDYNKLIDCIINNDKENALLIYNEFKKLNQDTVSILMGLAKKIILMYQVKELSCKGYSDVDISELVNESKGYVYYLKKDGYRYSSNQLLNYIKLFGDMDYKYKTGQIELNTYFELFILKK